MLPLRYAGRWRVASLVLLSFVLLAALMPVVWFWGDRVGGLNWFRNVDKWAHGITFFVLAVWFTGMFARRQYILVFVGLLLFGMLIEGSQYLVSYRTADWRDVGANAAGIVLGILVATLGSGGWCQRLEDRWLRSRSA